MCLFLTTIQIEKGSVIVKHTRISSSIPKSLSRFLLLNSVKAENPDNQHYQKSRTPAG